MYPLFKTIDGITYKLTGMNNGVAHYIIIKRG